MLDTGIWVPTEIDGCETTESIHGDPPRKVTEDAGELPALAASSVEALVGLEPGSVIERAGYPEQEGLFRARRNGRTVATMSFYPDGEGGWLEGEATACVDEGGSSESRA